MAVALLILLAAVLLSGSVIYGSFLLKTTLSDEKSLYVSKKIHPQKDVAGEPSIIEMSPEKFKELPYRKRMTPAEAAIWYEKKNEERIREEMKKLG